MKKNDQNTLSEMETQVVSLCKKAKTASYLLATASSAEKNRWLEAMATALESSVPRILEANRIDMAHGAEKGLSEAMLDRLLLNEKRISAMAEGLRHVTTLPDPVGKVLSSVTRPNGIRIDKVSVPLGVIAFIYESRPNVTVDASCLCLKAGNAVVMRGGSEALESNRAIASVVIENAEKAGMPSGAVQLFDIPGHDAVSVLLKQDRYVNLVIPRGGERLIRAVVEQSTIPVIKHYKGICHLYIDSAANQEMALEILKNGKFQRPGVCNALESVLIHKEIASSFVPRFAGMFAEEGGKAVYGDARYCALDAKALPVSDESFSTEYLDLKLSAAVVDSVEAAIEHINRYGSGHSDCIVTEDGASAEYFLNGVDSSSVYWNASTRFTDGGEFGMGAEIGISTDKLHARGPMGLGELTSYKYKIYGSGQIRK